MKLFIDNFYHLFNTVRKSNSIKLNMLYAINSISYFLTQLMRLLNY